MMITTNVVGVPLARVRRFRFFFSGASRDVRRSKLLSVASVMRDSPNGASAVLGVASGKKIMQHVPR
jgi:hypothetical protein